MPSMSGLDLATRVSTAKSYKWHEGVEPVSKSERLAPAGDPNYHVVAYDFGIKRNILRKLVQSGTRVTVVPALTPAEDVIGLKPDGIFLSNGPGDPEPLEFQQAQVRKLIGQGADLRNLSWTPDPRPLAGRQDLQTEVRTSRRESSGAKQSDEQGRDHIAQSRIRGGCRLARDSEVELTHVNLNDETLEGFRHKSHPVFCVQYHPEAAPGPHDSYYLFDEFVKLMKENKGR